MPRHKSINLDGGYFGTSFPHVFLKVRSIKRVEL